MAGGGWRASAVRTTAPLDIAWMATKHASMRRVVVCVPLLASIHAAGCFELQRGDDLIGGVITGVAVDADGEIATGAVASIVELDRTSVVDARGRFRFEGLPVGARALRVVVDADGDGRAEIGAQRSVLIDAVDDFDDETADVAGGIDLGEVILAPTGRVTGRVVDIEGNGVGDASVALWRQLPGSSNAAALELAADVITTSGDDGRFTIDNVIVGAADIAAFDVVGNVTTHASVAKAIDVPAEGEARAGDLELVAVEGTRPARIRFSELVDGNVEIRLAPVNGVRPGEPTRTIPGEGLEHVRFDVPFGIWDVYVDVVVGTDVRRGRLRSQVATSSSRTEVSWGVVELAGGPVTLPGECGDGVRQEQLGEGCDDGTANSDVVADACRSDCQPASCSDGVVDSGEDCDDGVDNGNSAVSTCSANCHLASCGDGVDDENEGCDDGAANTDGCVPAPGSAGCDYCERDTCIPRHVDGTASIVVDVVSLQAWELRELAGVPVEFEAVLPDDVTLALDAVTDDAGRATFSVPATASGSSVVVGGADQRDATRMFLPQRFSVPALGHAAQFDIAASLYEGCVLVDDDTVEEGKGKDAGFRVAGGPVLPVIQAFSLDNDDCRILDQNLDGDSARSFFDSNRLETSTWTAHVAATPRGLADPRAFAAFPVTIDDSGDTLQCSALFDFRLQNGATINPDAVDPVRIFANGVAAWRFDDDSGRFVLDAAAGNGDPFTLPRDGLWCYGNVAPDTACVDVVVDDEAGNPVSGAAVDVVSDLEGFVTVARGVTDASGNAGCIAVTGARTAIGVRAVDGRRATVRLTHDPIIGGGEEPEPEPEPIAAALGVGGSIGTQRVTLSTAPFESCLIIAPTVVQNSDSVFPSRPPLGTLGISENTDEGTVPRGRVPWNASIEQRCVAVPNDRYTLRVEYDRMDDDCASGGNGTDFVDFSRQRPSSDPPVCSDSGDCSVADIDFFCSGS